MNFIQHTLQPKMMTIWRLIAKNTQSYRGLGVVLLFLVVFFSMLGHVSAGETSSGRTINVITTPKPALSTDLVKERSSARYSFTGRIQLLTQSQITPTVSSYPSPFPSTIDSTDNSLGGIEEPYPDLTPNSIEQPLIPYPEAQNGGIQGSDLNSEFAQTPSAQNPESLPSIGSNNSENTVSNNIEQTQTSSVVSAVILWIGFLASLMIFLSAILWSILNYSRQRSRE